MIWSDFKPRLNAACFGGSREWMVGWVSHLLLRCFLAVVVAFQPEARLSKQDKIGSRLIRLVEEEIC